MLQCLTNRNSMFVYNFFMTRIFWELSLNANNKTMKVLINHIWKKYDKSRPVEHGLTLWMMDYSSTVITDEITHEINIKILCFSLKTPGDKHLTYQSHTETCKCRHLFEKKKYSGPAILNGGVFSVSNLIISQTNYRRVRNYVLKCRTQTLLFQHNRLHWHSPWTAGIDLFV